MAEQNGAIRVLTALEAAERLRLTEDYEQPEDALAALLRLVRSGRLKPLRCGKTYKFTDVELDRFAVDETAAFRPTKRERRTKRPTAAADVVTMADPGRIAHRSCTPDP